MKVKIKALHPDAQIPVYATDGSGAFDLHSITEGDTAVITGESRSFRTGLAIEVPKGHLMFVLSRSGHGFNHSTRLTNVVGLIDSDFRGEVAVKLTRDYEMSNKPLTVKNGDRSRRWRLWIHRGLI